MLTCMVIARSKVIEEHVFKDRKLIKKNYVIDWEEEQILQQFFVKSIQEMQVENPSKNLTQKEKCRNLNLGLTTQGKCLQGCGLRK